MAERKPLIAGNWKMHLDHLEAIQLVQQLAYHLDPADYDACDVAVVPPFTALRSISTLIEGDRLPLGLGAQNCFYEESGAYTGEISPGMLAKLKVDYVICGHSERRTLFGETDDVVNRKVRAVLAHGMTPIVCVGETDEQRERGEAHDVVSGQVRRSLAGVTPEQAGELVVAYEPVWAIGTGKTATTADANEMCRLIRQLAGDQFGAPVAARLRVQYGGSVKAGNAAELLAASDIDGALVGGASLDADDFAIICKSVRRRAAR